MFLLDYLLDDRKCLSENDWESFTSGKISSYFHGPNPDGNTLFRIANATEKDAGMYACIVGTGEEHVESVAYLSVEEGAEYIATSIAREAIY